MNKDRYRLPVKLFARGVTGFLTPGRPQGDTRLTVLPLNIESIVHGTCFLAFAQRVSGLSFSRVADLVTMLCSDKTLFSIFLIKTTARTATSPMLPSFC